MICQTDQTTPSTRPTGDSQGHRPFPMANQNGSVMVLALMIMAVMMVIVIASSDTVVTENYIIRNVGIHKENVNLVESALMMGLQRFMQIPDNDPDNFDPDISNTDWINNRNDAWTTGAWYNRGDVSTMLNANNSLNGHEDGFRNNVMATLATRGEAANGGLRYAIVGWEPVDLRDRGQFEPGGGRRGDLACRPNSRGVRLRRRGRCGQRQRHAAHGTRSQKTMVGYSFIGNGCSSNQTGVPVNPHNTRKAGQV